MKFSIFAPYIGVKRPPHISQPTDGPRSGFIWCLVTPQGYSKFSKKFSKIFENFASYDQNRRKTDFFEWLKSHSAAQISEFFCLPCLTTYMELSKKFKKFTGTQIFFRDFLHSKFCYILHAHNLVKKWPKKISLTKFFSKFIHLYDAPQWVT